MRASVRVNEHTEGYYLAIPWLTECTAWLSGASILVEVLRGHSFIRYFKPKLDLSNKRAGCTFICIASPIGELWGHLKNQFFLDISVFVDANFFALRRFIDIGMVLQCGKFDKRATNITSYTAENVENTSISLAP